MLDSAVEHYQVTQKLTAAAIVGARRRRSSPSEMLTFLTVMQIAAAQEGADSIAEMAAEQGLDPELVADVIAVVFGGVTPSGQSLEELLDHIAEPGVSDADLTRLVRTLVTDAARDGQQVAIAATPTTTGYIRYLNPPSCARCAILAGRRYRWSTGFLRHPNCDCVMIPVGDDVPDGLLSDPMTAFENGDISGMSKADVAAVEAGADLGQVTNVRLKAAGLSVGGIVQKRGSRLTPAGIFRIASDRAEVIALLKRFGYLR